MEHISYGEFKRFSIASAFEPKIEKGDENHFSSPEAFQKAIVDNKWLVYSEEDILKFEKAVQDRLSDIEKGGDEIAKTEIIEKAKKDLSKLTQKLVTDKRGFTVKRWVSNGGENKITELERLSEDTEQSMQQLLDEKISKKNYDQMKAHREDAEYEAFEKKLNAMAHEVVEETKIYTKKELNDLNDTDLVDVALSLGMKSKELKELDTEQIIISILDKQSE